MYQLVLASASVRRHQILSDAGYRFTVVDPGDAEEGVTAGDPAALAMAKARIKAQEVVLRGGVRAPALVVGADTLVVQAGEVLGKPMDRRDAVRILGRLSGTRHQVLTGLCLWPCGSSRPAVLEAVGTWVTMAALTEREIEAYVASGEADGKAGAYAIQETGDRFVEKVEGSFLNVVGFPLERFQELLREIERDEFGLGPR